MLFTPYFHPTSQDYGSYSSDPIISRISQHFKQYAALLYDLNRLAPFDTYSYYAFVLYAVSLGK